MLDKLYRSCFKITQKITMKYTEKLITLSQHTRSIAQPKAKQTPDSHGQNITRTRK